MNDETVISCDSVVFDREVYPRNASSTEVVERYRMNIDGLPPIVVTKDRILVDGYHRLAAHRQEGRTEIRAEVVDIPRDRVKVEAARLNATHGHQLNAAEKQALAIEMHTAGDKDEVIAAVLAVSVKQVERYLKETKREERERLKEKAWDLYLEGLSSPDIQEQTGIDDSTVNRWITQKRQMSEMSLPDPLRVFNIWNFPDPATEYGDVHRFGTVDPQVIEHLLHYFTAPDAMVVDPMAGNGVTIDVCKRFGRRCLAYDIAPVDSRVRPNDITNGLPDEAHNCDLMVLDPPYFNNMVSDAYPTLDAFYAFIRRVAEVVFATVRPGGIVAFIMADGDHHRFVPLIDECHIIFHALPFENIARISSPLPTNTSGTAPIVDRAKEHRQILYRDRVIHIYRRPE